MNQRIANYIHLFNLEQDYFECHEEGEALWFERNRPYVLKGLIQGAVCLYHLRRGNIRGSQLMWSRAKTYLTRYVSNVAQGYEGVDIPRFIRNVDAVHQRIPIEWHGRRISADTVSAHALPKVMVRLSRVSRGTLRLPRS